MATLTAVQVGTLDVELFNGSQTLANQSTFSPVGTTLEFDHSGNQKYASFVGGVQYTDPNLDAWVYAITDEGNLRFSGTANLGAGVTTTTAFFNVSAIYNASSVIAAQPDTVNETIYLANSGSLTLTSGAVSDPAMNVISDIINSPYANYGIAYWGLFAFSDNDYGYVFDITDNDAIDPTIVYLYSSNGIALTQKQILSQPSGGNTFDGPICNISGARNRMICSTFDGVNTLTQLVDFAFTNYGDPLDFTIDDLAFDVAGLIDEWDDIFTDGTYFYFVYITDSVSAPINPYILRVNAAFTEYTEITISTNDATVQARINNYLAGNGTLSFALGPDGALLMTGGDEPMFYASSISHVMIYDRTTKIPSPVHLPCYVNCIPVIDRRLYRW